MANAIYNKYGTKETTQQGLFSDNRVMTTNIAIVYVMFIVLIARYISGYLWGIFASIIAVIAINFFFSEPIMELNFVKDGYPITFAGILEKGFLLKK